MSLWSPVLLLFALQFNVLFHFVYIFGGDIEIKDWAS